MIIEKIIAGPLDTNAYLIGCEKTLEAAVIDPGLQSASRLLRIAEEKKLQIKKILLTHSHWDHFGDAHLIKEKLGISLYISEKDKENLKNPGADEIPMPFSIEPVDFDFFYEDKIFVGEIEFKVIPTPGHTPGGVCFYSEKEKVLFSGDTLFKESYGIVHSPTGSPERMRSSLKKLRNLPSDTKVYPGHGLATSIGEESWLEEVDELFY